MLCCYIFENCSSSFEKIQGYMIQCVDAINSSRFRSEVCVPRDPKLLVCVISFCWQPLFFWSFERLGVGYGERSERAKRNRQQVVHYHRRNCSFLSFFLRFRESCEQWPRHHVKMCNGHTHTHTHTHANMYIGPPFYCLNCTSREWAAAKSWIRSHRLRFNPLASRHTRRTLSTVCGSLYTFFLRSHRHEWHHLTTTTIALETVHRKLYTWQYLLLSTPLRNPFNRKRGPRARYWCICIFDVLFLSCYCVNVLPFLFHVWIASLFLFDNSY